MYFQSKGDAKIHSRSFTIGLKDKLTYCYSNAFSVLNLNCNTDDVLIYAFINCVRISDVPTGLS